jgi:hypothetical protein
MAFKNLCTKALMLMTVVISTSSYASLFNWAKPPLVSGDTWLIDFDDHETGDYTWMQHYFDWSGPKWQKGRNLITVVDGDEAFSGKSLKLKYLKGVSSCKGRKTCINWPVDLGVKTEKLYYGYRFKLSDDFDFIKGGKFPGISGGRGNSGGKRPTGRDGWSVRMMWDGKGRLVQYVYHPDQPGRYGDVMPFEIDGEIERGLWHTVQTLVELNTPGKKDGRIVSWLDGKKVLVREEMRFRKTSGLKIDRFQFMSFFGGYGPDWAPHKDEYSYIDDVRFSLTTPPFFDN